MESDIWRLLDTGAEEPDFNMALDIALLESVLKGESPPVLRFYAWSRPSVSLGYFQSLRELSLETCHVLDIPVVRRPTGGRALLHGKELTYSFGSLYSGPFKASLYDTYRVISLCFVDALRRLGLPVKMEERKKVRYGHNPLCFLSTSYGEVMLEGQKIMGSAQRRFRKGFLQQGSMPYYVERDLIERIFNNSALSGLSEIMEAHGMEPLKEDSLKEEIIRAFERRFNIKFKREEPSFSELKRAQELKGLFKINKGAGDHRKIDINLDY